MLSERGSNMLYDVLLIALSSLAASHTGDMGFVKNLSFSSMIVGIILGMLYANSLRNNSPDTWVPGILFYSKCILRIDIILHGFGPTFRDATAMGLPAILIDVIIVTVTVCGGVLIGKLLKVGRSITLLISVDSGICGVVTTLGVELTINTRPYKTAVAVSIVVIFGTLSMLLYLVLYRNGTFDLSLELMGLFTSSTVHEVAHVVGAGSAMGQGVSSTAIIVKITRMMIPVPALLVISWTAAHNLTKRDFAEQAKGRVIILWSAILFLVVIGFNLFNLLFVALVEWIDQFDTFPLIVTMTALGAEASFDKLKKAGTKSFLLAAILFVQLIGGGYCLAKYVALVLMNIQGT